MKEGSAWTIKEEKHYELFQNKSLKIEEEIKKEQEKEYYFWGWRQCRGRKRRGPSGYRGWCLWKRRWF